MSCIKRGIVLVFLACSAQNRCFGARPFASPNVIICLSFPKTTTLLVERLEPKSRYTVAGCLMPRRITQHQNVEPTYQRVMWNSSDKIDNTVCESTTEWMRWKSLRGFVTPHSLWFAIANPEFRSLSESLWFENVMDNKSEQWSRPNGWHVRSNVFDEMGFLKCCRLFRWKTC